MTARGWLVSWQRQVAGLPALVCLPQAGAGSGQYRPWQRELAGDYAMFGVTLPGREARWGEPPATSMDHVVSEVAAAVAGQVPRDVPVVVFGQSFGGLIGFEVVRRLEEEHGRPAAALVVAACRPPHHWVGAGHGLTDGELTGLMDLRGLDDLDEDTRELMLEVLRQDVRLSESYAAAPTTPIAAPIHAWGGEQDDIVTGDHLAGWSAYTSDEFRHRRFPGGHYFCLRDKAAMTALAQAPIRPPIRVMGG